MDKSEELSLVFTGNQHQVFLLKEISKENRIASIVRNRFESGMSVGFVGGTPSTIELLVSNSNLEKAIIIAEAFKKS